MLAAPMRLFSTAAHWLLLVVVLALAACRGGAKGGRTVGDPRFDPEPVGRDACADDTREENDSLVSTASTDKAVHGAKPVTLGDLVSCPGDDDWIHAYSKCCEDAGVTVTWKPEDGDLRVDLVDQTGNVYLLVGSGDSAEREPGKAKLVHGSHSHDFYVRIRNRSGTRVPYAAEVVARAGP